MSLGVSFEAVENPEPYPTLYWMDKVKDGFHYIGWQGFFPSPSGLKRSGEICKVKNVGPAWPRGLRKMMREDAALYAETTAGATIMKLKLITGIVLALALVSNSYAGNINAVTGLSQGTAWTSFTDQLEKSTTKRDAFLAGLGGVRHTQVALTAAQINGMYAAPVLLIAAPATGKAIAVNKLMFTITRTATAFASGGAAIVQYDSTVNGGGTQALDSTLASTVITGAAGTSISIRNGAIISDSTATIVAKGIYLSNATGAFTTGTGTAVVDIWYTVTP